MTVSLFLVFGAAGAARSGSLLRSLSMPDGDFTLTLVDITPGDDLWNTLTADHFAQPLSDSPFAEGPLSDLARSIGGYGVLMDYELGTTSGVFLGEPSQSQLNDYFGVAHAGVWESPNAFVSTVDKSTYFSQYAADLPREPFEKDRSLAADESVVATLNLLQSFDGYAYTLQRGTGANHDVFLFSGAEVSPIVTYGSVVSIENGRPVLRIAYDFGSVDEAQQSLPGLEQALLQVAESYGEAAPQKVYHQDRFVVGEFTAWGPNFASVGYQLLSPYGW